VCTESITCVAHVTLCTDYCDDNEYQRNPRTAAAAAAAATTTAAAAAAATTATTTILCARCCDVPS